MIEFDCKCCGPEGTAGNPCFGCRANAAIHKAVAEERERIAKLADDLGATYTTTEKGWGLGGPNGTICASHDFAVRIRQEPPT